jgi:undecaprenyl-diphosphatase
MEYLTLLNQALFLKMNALPGTAPWILAIAIFIAKHLIVFIPILLIALWLWGDRHKKEVALQAFVVTLLGLLISQMIGWIWPSPRPFMLGLGHAWLAHAPNYSFPSDHATIFACVACTLFFQQERKLAWLICLMGIGVAWSRVYLGIHFPLDILGGILLGFCANKLVTKVWVRQGENLTSYLIQIYRLIFAPLIKWGVIKR